MKKILTTYFPIVILHNKFHFCSLICGLQLCYYISLTAFCERGNGPIFPIFYSNLQLVYQVSSRCLNF